MKKNLLYLAVVLLFSCCGREAIPNLKEGPWRGGLQVQDGRELPFGFTLQKTDSSWQIQVSNAGEILQIDEIRLKKDSIYIHMPVFEGYVAATFNDTLIRGNFITESRGREVPFLARYGEGSRFPAGLPSKWDVSGIWEVTFSKDTADEYPAKGIFTQKNSIVNGTFRTTTGDYRYLEGRVNGDTLKLSTFDGAHAFLFVAHVEDSLMQGTFYSGNHFKEPFVGRMNPDYELPDENSLTYLKEGFERFEFQFPDLTGKQVSLADQQFRNKVVIVQIMGSWCPNCLDETKFLVEYLRGHPEDDLEVVALAFEYAKTREKAFRNIERLRKRVGVNYPILLAQFGGGSKMLAHEKLPMLNHVLSYPTTIFIDRDGKVRRIHTGFNGPATGDKYEEFKSEFHSLVMQMLAE